jgi:predicted O-methyltransferase YrrM
LWIRDTRDPELFADLKHLSPFDILFIDTDHTLEQATFEYATYAPLVRNGGIILFDDIHMNDMTAFWNTITARKIELNHLHCTGFGAVLAESDRS